MHSLPERIWKFTQHPHSVLMHSSEESCSHIPQSQCII